MKTAAPKNYFDETIWVVTTPQEGFVLEDIIYGGSWKSLFNQIRGGLDVSEVYGVFFDHDTAVSVAVQLLAKRKH